VASEGLSLGRAYLTSHGAIWGAGEWRDGALLTNTATPNTLFANGDHAAWSNGTLSVRDLANGATSTIHTSVSTFGIRVAANGNVAYTFTDPTDPYASQRIGWFHGGVDEFIAAGCSDPETDGINIAYRQYTLGEGGEAVYVYTPSLGEIPLAPHEPAGTPDQTYVLAGGWTAFVKGDPTPQAIVYTRSPDGTIAQASVFNALTSLDALDESGNVVYGLNEPWKGGVRPRRYLGRAGGGIPALFAESRFGRAVHRNGVWYVILGSTVLQYVSGSGGDAGADAGATDVDTDGPPGDGDAGPPSDALIPSDVVSDVGNVDGPATDASVDDVISIDVSSDAGGSDGTSSDAGAPDAETIEDGRGADTTKADADSVDASSPDGAPNDAPRDDVSRGDTSNGDVKDATSSLDAGRDGNDSTPTGMPKRGSTEAKGVRRVRCPHAKRAAARPFCLPRRSLGLRSVDASRLEIG
jgi:hypothetical protein